MKIIINWRNENEMIKWINDQIIMTMKMNNINNNSNNNVENDNNDEIMNGKWQWMYY